MAFLMFSSLAGNDVSFSNADLPENSTTLNISVGLRFSTKLRIRFLDISSGLPCIEPDTSTMNMYSRGGMSLSRTRCGGCTIIRKKFSSLPSYSITPDSISFPCSEKFTIKSLLPPFFSVLFSCRAT